MQVKESSFSEMEIHSANSTESRERNQASKL